ncbi:MAG: rhodanese-like domain-containing protein [Acidobacteriota bacterium]|nr:rhodanese-like domain-containing protein [Acidobacteriota bacterium]
MRYIISLLMISALVFGLACQSASSSSTQTKNEKTADSSKNLEAAETTKAESKADIGDGHDHSDDEAPRISLKDAKDAYDKDEAVIIDTRAALQFKTEHIKGAISVPAGEFEKYYKGIPKDKKIIAYCS